MFPSSVIRKLARSEEMFAETQNFVVSPLTSAVRSTSTPCRRRSTCCSSRIQSWAVISRGEPTDGTRSSSTTSSTRESRWSNSMGRTTGSAADLRPVSDAHPPAGDDRRREVQSSHLHPSQPGRRPPSVQPPEEFFASYTDLVTTGKTRPPSVHPAPDPLEKVLADRGVQKREIRPGADAARPVRLRTTPVRRAPSAVNPVLPQLVPMVECTLGVEETERIIAYCRANKVGVNSLLAAVVLMAEWQIRRTPKIPVPYVYPVDLRYVLSPPVSATECTNPVGIATYLAEITEGHRRRRPGPRYQRHLPQRPGRRVIQQSFPAFHPQYVGNPPGLPDVVMFTDNGVVPPLPTTRHGFIASHGEFYFAVGGGIEIYTSKIFAGRLMIEYHSHRLQPEKSIAAIEFLLHGGR